MHGERAVGKGTVNSENGLLRGARWACTMEFMTISQMPRRRPCATCPYRRDVPSGIWSPAEYRKLPEYDGEMARQSCKVFLCHQGTGPLCAGWVATHGPENLLAVRIGISIDAVSPEVLGYTTSVPVFTTGAEAAAHGMSNIDDPAPEACAAIAKIMQVRALESEDCR